MKLVGSSRATTKIFFPACREKSLRTALYRYKNQFAAVASRTVSRIAQDAVLGLAWFRTLVDFGYCFLNGTSSLAEILELEFLNGLGRGWLQPPESLDHNRVANMPLFEAEEFGLIIDGCHGRDASSAN